MKAPVPTIRGKQLRLHTLDGPNGKFEIAGAGTDKEGTTTYFYRDETMQCFFLVSLRTQPNPSWLVSSVGQFGKALRASVEQEVLLKQNIEFFFKTRDWSNPGNPAKTGVGDWPVDFQWRVER